MPTILERIETALTAADYEIDNVDKLIAIAYYVGRETATREICDKHNERVKAMRTYATTLRYHHIANAVIDAGKPDIIYDPHYAGDMQVTFGKDTTNI